MLKDKKILILGATRIIGEIVQEAKNMGIYTIAVDYNVDAPAKKIADESWLIDVFDYKKIVGKIKEENVDGIITGYADSLLPAYYEICKLANKPCYITSKHQLDFAIKKDVFKTTCKKYSVPTIPEFNNSEDLQFPVLVKPVDSSGSRGIFVCNNKEEYNLNYKKSLEYSKSKTILTEKYLEGDEIVIYYAFQNGESILTAICDRYTNKEQHGLAQLPTAYIFPSKYTNLYKDTVDKQVRNMFKCLNFTNGQMFLQAFVQDESIYFYEPGFRLNGAQDHIILSSISGFNTQKMLINFAITGKMSETSEIANLANPNFHKYACKLSPLIKKGRIASIDGLENISKLKDVVDIKTQYSAGEEVGQVGTLQQIFARFFIVSDNIKDLAYTIDAIQSELSIKDENNRELLYGLFDTKELGNYKEDL